MGSHAEGPAALRVTNRRLGAIGVNINARHVDAARLTDATIPRGLHVSHQRTSGWVLLRVGIRAFLAQGRPGRLLFGLFFTTSFASGLLNVIDIDGCYETLGMIWARF